MRDDANARRKKPVNQKGCKPIEDVCVEHDRPLVCRHGCDEAKDHVNCNAWNERESAAL